MLYPPEYNCSCAQFLACWPFLTADTSTFSFSVSGLSWHLESLSHYIAGTTGECRLALSWEEINFSGRWRISRWTLASPLSSRSTIWWCDLHVFQQVPNRTVLQWFTVLTCSLMQLLFCFLSFLLSMFFTSTFWDHFPNKFQVCIPASTFGVSQTKTVW